MYVTKLSCTCRKRIKWKKRKEKKRNKTKQKKPKLDKRKEKKRKENKIEYIIYTVIYFPDNGAKNLTRPKD
jgi:hypothetical protein